MDNQTINTQPETITDIVVPFTERLKVVQEMFAKDADRMTEYQKQHPSQPQQQ